MTPIEKEGDFDSEEDQALLDCVKLDLEAEEVFNRVGKGSTPIFVTNSMWSYIINYPLSSMLKKMRVTIKNYSPLMIKMAQKKYTGGTHYSVTHGLRTPSVEEGCW